MSFLTPEILKGTDWRAVERAVARLMSHVGWSSVRIVGGAGDEGADILASKFDTDRVKAFVVQVKAVMGGRYVGVAAVQEAVRALSTYSGDVAVVATNGDFTGTAYIRRDQLRAEGFDVRLWNGRFLQDLFSVSPTRHFDRRPLRPYQADIVARCLEKYQAGGHRTQFIVATGLGKTVIASEILSELLQRDTRSALVLCHAQELALQLEQSFWTQLDKSVPTRVFFGGSLPKPCEGVNFGLYQTFVSYLSGTDPMDYDVVIVDEAHHAMAHGFRRCLDHLRPRFLVGMTATPWRGDGMSIDALFGEPSARVSLVDGMKMGFLAKTDYRIYCDTIDWENLRTVSGGGMSIAELNRRVFVPQRDEAIIDELASRCIRMSNPRIIAFCASIEHCRRFAGLLSASSNLVCKPLSGVDKVERNRTLMEFASGKIQAVTAVDILNEGIDVPDVNVLLFLRSTHSRRIFIQQLGRGLRLAPSKEHVLVLDFVTDIRRLADVIQMDRESRRPSKGYQDVYFRDGFVTFVNEAALPFVNQWLQDVADLGDADESHVLRFPEAV